MKILLGKSQIAMRKCRGVSRNLTAGHLKQQGALERLVHLDEGFKFLRALRGSLPYFECAKKDLFAMIRQAQQHCFVVFRQLKHIGYTSYGFLVN